MEQLTLQLPPKGISLYRTALTKDRRIPVLVSEKEIEYGERDLNYGSPRSIAKMLNEAFEHGYRTEEYVYLVCFDAAMHCVGVFELSHGTVNMSPMEMRAIFTKAMLCGANSFVIAHNHPSGDATPSGSDRACASRIALMGILMEIKLVDFLIITDKTFMSFKEMNLIPESVKKDELHELVDDVFLL